MLMGHSLPVVCRADLRQARRLGVAHPQIVEKGSCPLLGCLHAEVPTQWVQVKV